MTRALRIKARMIPAMESRPSDPTIGDIGPVPAVKATVESGDKSVSCIGVIDTGADLSILDEALFEPLAMQAPLATIRLRTAGLSELPIPVYTATIRLRGESEDELVFSDVPVVRSRMERPVLLLGRRGLLEWLRVEIDFPKGMVSLVRSYHLAGQYPALALNLPGFASIAELIEKGSPASREVVLVIAQTAMALESFLDRVIGRQKLARPPSRPLTLGEKLRALSRERNFEDLEPEMQMIAEYRNAVMHGKSDSLKPLSLKKFLAAAERITARLTSESKTRIS